MSERLKAPGLVRAGTARRLLCVVVSVLCLLLLAGGGHASADDWPPTAATTVGIACDSAVLELTAGTDRRVPSRASRQHSAPTPQSGGITCPQLRIDYAYDPRPHQSALRAPASPLDTDGVRLAVRDDAVLGSDAGVAAEGRVAAMDSFSESGATISHSRTATAIGDDANTMTNSGRSRGAAGHDVIVHGDVAGNFRVNGDSTNPNQIADAIRGNPNYGGGPINLVTCHGACGAAQELQGIMGVPVNASPFRVDLDPWSGFLREFR